MDVSTVVSRVAAAAVLWAAGAGVAGATETLSRAEAVAEALRANPAVARAREELRGLEGRKREAIADALPEVTLVGTALRYRDPSLLNSPGFDSFPPELRELLRVEASPLYEGSARVHQTLFSFRLGSAIRAARHGLAMGEEMARMAERDVALAAVRAYDGYLLALAKAQVAAQVQKQKEEHLATARHRREAGTATDLDVLRSQVDLENQRSELLAARSHADLARGALNAVLERPIDAPVEPSDSLAYVAFDVGLEEVVAEALAHRPEVRAAQERANAYEHFIGVAKADSRPRLDFDGSWGYSVRRPGDFGDGDFTRWNGSVTLTVPVFDGRRTAGRVAQARAEAGKMVQDRRALETQVRLQAKEGLDRLRVADAILQAAEANVAQARRALEMTETNYRYGAATTLDVLDAQAAFALAESTRITARHGHAAARATLRYVMGRDPVDPVPGGE